MPYLAVDEDNVESIFETEKMNDGTEVEIETVKLPKGTIFKLIGRVMTQDDDPVELTEEMVKEPEKPDYYVDIEWVNDWAKFRAIDLSGLVIEFEFEPYANDDCQLWDIVGDTERYSIVRELKITIPNWKLTLQERTTK